MSFNAYNEYKLHEKTPFECGEFFRGLIQNLPDRQFSELSAGDIVYYKDYGGEQLLKVIRLTPSAKIAEVQSFSKGQEFSKPYKMYKSRCSGLFKLWWSADTSSELNTWLLSIIGLTHLDFVKKAIAEGLVILARVKVYYPELFIEIPERFTVERVKNFLKPEFGKHVDNGFIDECIENCHKQIKKLAEDMPKSIVLNPHTEKDWNRYIDNYVDGIDFYEWIREYVNTVFYTTIPTKQN